MAGRNRNISAVLKWLYWFREKPEIITDHKWERTHVCTHAPRPSMLNIETVIGPELRWHCESTRTNVHFCTLNLDSDGQNTDFHFNSLHIFTYVIYIYIEVLTIKLPWTLISSKYRISNTCMDVPLLVTGETNFFRQINSQSLKISIRCNNNTK